MAQTTYWGTGRRKTAIARVRLVKGKGDIIVNKKKFDEYFGRKTLQTIIKRPLQITGNEDKYDVIAKITGSGPEGQAGALIHGIARALLKVNDEWREQLKKAGLLTRDPRMKERKKYGLKGARKAPQYSKR